ncbi:hypothetical protein [Pantoea agglomerans]
MVDILTLSDMQYQTCAGGASFNIAIGAVYLFCHSGRIGRVGDDEFSHFLKNAV